MVEINAKTDATIEVLSGDFPLGNRDTMLVHILDPLITERLGKFLGTGTCLDKYNYYTYGKFENTKDVDNLSLELLKDSVVDIVSGIGDNYSRCLHCFAGELGFGNVYMNPNKSTNLEAGKKYIFSCYVKGRINFVAENLFNITVGSDNTNNWEFVRHEFTVTNNATTFNLRININSGQNCYIDNVMLFDSQYEINKKESIYDIGLQIDIINPCNQCNKINRIINWEFKEDGTVDALLYFPEITNVDFQDNILCVFKTVQHMKRKAVTLGNTVYFEKDIVLFKSEPFVLHGYILPPDNIDYDIDADLIVGRI